MHQVLWWLERSEVGALATGAVVLGLPLAKIVAAKVIPADWEAIVARVGPSPGPDLRLRACRRFACPEVSRSLVMTRGSSLHVSPRI
jgi:hypothetical protein